MTPSSPHSATMISTFFYYKLKIQFVEEKKKHKYQTIFCQQVKYTQKRKKRSRMSLMRLAVERKSASKEVRLRSSVSEASPLVQGTANEAQVE